MGLRIDTMKLIWTALISAGLMAAAHVNTAFPPHKIADNLYYVGTAELSSYLVTTGQGNILINPSFEDSVPLIQASVEKLGFKFGDTKILLISHAHDDHAAGCARVKQLTGAKLMVMDADVAEVESGGKGDFQYVNSRWPVVKVDRVLHDGDQVKLGAAVLTAHLTPGHTKGCTTWTMRTGGYNVVIVGSPNVNAGYKLVNNALYPNIASDFERTFRVLKSLPCDIFLGAHGNYYGMAAKYEKLKAGGVNPFVDPAGYRAYIENRERAFRDEWKRQTASAKGL